MRRGSQYGSLGLWMNEDHVGTWNRHSHGGYSLEYDQEWVCSDHARPLSLSLPFLPGSAKHHGQTVLNYFENLLPDSDDIRERLGARFKADPGSAFDLLEQIGRDCVGALQILPSGEIPHNVKSIDASPLNEHEVAELLRRTVHSSAHQDQKLGIDDFRICIAGAQEKTALLLVDGQWCRPHGSTPTTHILKLPMGLVGNMRADMSTSVENEWLCSLILREYGLPVAHATPMQFEDVKVLSVVRFDRHWECSGHGAPWVRRLAQEDLCQATGTPPTQKYEAEGGPGMATVVNVLKASDASERDLQTFFKAQVLFWMLAATDGHAKNFSLALHADGGYRLTDLYDVLSAYPIIGAGPNRISPYKAKLAMAVRSKNVHWKIHEIQRRHWQSVGDSFGVCGAGTDGARAVINELIERTPRVVDLVSNYLPKGFPSQLADSILTGLTAAARRLAAC